MRLSCLKHWSFALALAAIPARLETCFAKGNRHLLRSTFLLVALGVTALSASAQTLWSIQGDWSNISNPNGAWTLTNNGTPFATQYPWQDGSLTVPVNAWASSAGPTTTQQLPAWYQAVKSGDGGDDYLAGDILSLIHISEPTRPY